MIRIAQGAPAIAVNPNQTEFAVLDGGLIRFYSSASGEGLGELEVALGEGELLYIGQDRLVVVIRTGDNTWIALVRRKDRTMLSRAELAGPARLLVGFAERIVLLDPTGERPRLGSIASDSIGFEPLQIRTPLRFASVTAENDFLFGARDEILRWDPVRKRAAAKLHLPFDPAVHLAGFASRHRQLWMVRGDRVRTYRFSDGRPQGEVRVSGPIEGVLHVPASSRLVLAVRHGKEIALEQLDLGTNETTPLGAPQHQALALIETTPAWLVGVDAGGEPVRTPLGPPSIMGELMVEAPKRVPGEGAGKGDWRTKLRPKRAAAAPEHLEDEDDEDRGDDGDGDDGERGGEEAAASAAEEVPARPAAGRGVAATAAADSPLRRAIAGPPRVERSGTVSPGSPIASVIARGPDRLAALVGPMGRHPLADLARFARGVLAAEPARVPSVSASRVLLIERRYCLSKRATTLCQLLYGMRLLGEPDGGLAPVEALRAFSPNSDSEVEAVWSEVLAVGDLGLRRLCELERGKLRLSETAARFLDGQTPRVRILDGESELDEPPEPANYRLDGSDLETQGAALGRSLGTPIALVAGSDLRTQIVEARLHGAVPLVDSTLFEPWILDEDWVTVVLRRRAHPQIDSLTVLDLEPVTEGASD